MCDTNRNMIPRWVANAERDRALHPRKATQPELNAYTVFLDTQHWLVDFYGSRTWRSLRFHKLQKKQRKLVRGHTISLQRQAVIMICVDCVVQRRIAKDIAPNPKSIIVFGANYMGRQCIDGEKGGPPPVKQILHELQKHHRVVMFNEYRTSQFSHCCWTKLEQVGTTRQYKCTSCGTKVDRDRNSTLVFKLLWRMQLKHGERSGPWSDPPEHAFWLNRGPPEQPCDFPA